MNEKEILFKILIVGDAEVGKTSFVRRYVNEAYDKNYKATVGGQERFTAMTRVYYRRASACLIMFDITKPNTFYNAAKWKKDLDSKCFTVSGKPIPCILVANKNDLPTKVEKEEINSMCKQQMFLGWTEMSVKDDKFVADTMNYLVTELMSPSSKEEEETQNIFPDPPEPIKSGTCCWS